MKHEDWLCKHCGSMMEMGVSHMHCSRSFHCGKLVPAWGIEDLPLACKVDYKRFLIDGEEGCWENAPHAHVSAMHSAPEIGNVVAKVPRKWGRNTWHVARTFKPATPPRG